MNNHGYRSAIWSALPGISLLLLLPAAVAAQDELAPPRVIKLPEASETSLPGDSSGARFGVAVRRGEGYPPLIVAEPEPEPPEAVEPEPVEETDVAPRSIGGY